VRHVGVSNVTPARVAEARRLLPIVCVQNHYNLAHRGDDALIGELARDGIAYVPFFPLGRFTPLQSSVLDDVARRLRATRLQVALAWLARRTSSSSPGRRRWRTFARTSPWGSSTSPGT
jgi:pyridoxine 4-dehydrogenase